MNLEPIMSFKDVGFRVFDGQRRRDILPDAGPERKTLLDGRADCQAFPKVHQLGHPWSTVTESSSAPNPRRIQAGLSRGFEAVGDCSPKTRIAEITHDEAPSFAGPAYLRPAK
jgi:hypothetical protein